MKRTIEGKTFAQGVKRELEITDLSAGTSSEFDHLVRLTVLNSRGGIESTMVCNKHELCDAVKHLI